MKPPTRPAIPRKNLAPHDPREETDALAADMLAYLAEDEARILRFFDLTGLTPQTLRRAAERPNFSTSLIEYLAADDRLFLGFAKARNVDPAAIEFLRQRLTQRTGEVD